jgi:hypothetical protein
MESPIAAHRVHSPAGEFRAMAGTMAMPWAIAAILPLPILLATDPASSGEIACVYLGLASGWLVVEFHRAEFHRAAALPQGSASWRTRMLGAATAVVVNVALFIAFGVAAGVQTHFPFPLMAALSAIPAIGIVPWLLRRVRQPYAALVLAAMLVLAAKLAGCVVARFVYGPDYMQRGYVSGDWRSAKLMISLFWSFSTLLSLGLLVAEYRTSARIRLERGGIRERDSSALDASPDHAHDPA